MKHTQQVEFDIKDLLPIGITFVVLGIALAFGLNIMSDIKAEFVTNTNSCGLNSTGGTTNVEYTACGADYNATLDAVTGVSKIPAKLPIIATTVVAAILIGIVVRYLFVQSR